MRIAHCTCTTNGIQGEYNMRAVYILCKHTNYCAVQ